MKHLKRFLAFVALACLAAPSALAAETKVVQDKNGDWALEVDGRPFFVRGVDYRVTKIGESPDEGTLRDWAYYDEDRDGRSDPAYRAWIDANANRKRDPDEPETGDFELMRKMGVNAVRWYVNDFHSQKANKALLRDLYKSYGIRVAVGNKFGAYTIDSGASWSDGTDYTDPEQRKDLLESVRRMVLEHKDEPYTLLWLLGNENNLRFTNTNAASHPAEWATFVNEAAKLIHELDGKHPVALVNGDTQLLVQYRKHCPDIDIFGVNSYRGAKGFGTLWKEVKRNLGKPVLVTEYGGSFANGNDEDAQAEYFIQCWRDIQANAAGGTGAGNSLGGFAFEWLDEWWKAGDPQHQADPGTTGRQGAGAMRWTQEYCGIYSQGTGEHSPLERRARKAAAAFEKEWKAEADRNRVHVGRGSEVEYL